MVSFKGKIEIKCEDFKYLIVYIYHILYQENMSVKKYPLIPHLHIVKLWYAGVYIFSYFCSKS